MAAASSPFAHALSLRAQLSPAAAILTDPNDAAFKSSMLRFSDVDLQIPGAILQPACEEDIVRIVKYAVEHAIPFVPKAGGYSLWSTIGRQGWVVDLALYNAVEVEVEKTIVRVQAGANTKQLNTKVGEVGFCVAASASGAVGVIPSVLGGGKGWLGGLYGLAVDNLVSARVVTATKGLVTASESENSELFWALKGAGQFFGLVTEITLRMHPMKDDIQIRTFIFGTHQAAELVKVIELEANATKKTSPGMCMLVQPPGAPKPAIVVNTLHFCSSDEADANVAPYVALQPLQTVQKSVGFAHITDSADAMSKPGGFKSVYSCGMSKFTTTSFNNALGLYEDLITRYPKALMSFFSFDWAGKEGLSKFPQESAAYSHRDCTVFGMAFASGEDEESYKVAFEYGEKLVALCQEDQKEDQKALFPNHSRVNKIEYRYRGEDRRSKLAALKKEWDPTGVFTRQFL